MSQTHVEERRLRPIYDNLEVGNNRKALQETEKLLKKHPNLLCARALKGLSLLRLGRYDESHNILQTVAEEKPVDDSTLQILSFCYKELEQLDKIVNLYHHAVHNNPGNEELLAHLFISYVRMEDFKSQQNVALQLYKVQPKNAYYFWAVMSVVLQAIRGPEKNNADKRKIFLALAQRMVDKLIKEDKLETEQEVLLYLRILGLQERHMEALEFLNGPICEKLYPGAPVTLKIDLLKKLEKWQDINTLLRDLLKDDRDRWDYYKEYINSCFQLIKLQGNTAASSAAATTDGELQILDDCHDFLCQLIESAEKKVRGPYLARIELHQRMRSENMDAKSLLGEFSELIIEYFRLFGDKSCCTHDIALFLPSISIEERQDLASKLLLESGISSTTLPQNKEQMQKHICALQLSRICGSHIDLKIEHLLAFYTALKLHYEHGLSYFGKNLLPTDMGPSDPYALLAANVMYDLSKQEQKSDHIFEALCLLQYALRNSTSNFHIKLLSLKIYHMFGCLLGAQEMYDYLDMKHIQLDSMGYIHCNLLPLGGRFGISRSVYDATLKFFTHSYKERLEYIAFAYRFCTFSKLEEFMNFKERLTNSIQYVATTVETQICDLVTLYGFIQHNLESYSAMSIDPTEDRISWNELSDNRDLSALIRWDPVHLIDLDGERQESFKQEVEVLHIRSLMLRLVASFIDLFHPKSIHKRHNTNNNNKAAKVEINGGDTVAGDGVLKCELTETIELLRDSWTTLFKRLRHTMNYKPLANRFLVDLLPTRLHLLLDTPYEKFYTDLSQFVLELYAGSKDLSNQCKIVSDNVSNLVETLANTIKESNEAVEDGLWRRREWQGKVSVCLETLSLYSFILSVFNEKIQVTPSTKSKSRKKQNTVEVNPEQPNQILNEKERSQLISDMMRHLKKKLQTSESLIENWKPPSLPRNLNSFMSDMSLKPEVELTLISDVATVFRESHELMVTAQRNLIKDKIRMVTK